MPRPHLCCRLLYDVLCAWGCKQLRGTCLLLQLACTLHSTIG